MRNKFAELIVITVVVITALIAFSVLSSKPMAEDKVQAATEVVQSKKDIIPDDKDEVVEIIEDASTAVETEIHETVTEAVEDIAEDVTEPEETAKVTIDLEAALAPRSIGNPDAPVKIQEFASLTCSHCAHFHKETFPDLKAKFIDTGDVYFTFTDFPLNAPALDAAILSRCMPEQHYFKFIKLLFDTQNQWAFTQNYKKTLSQNAKLLGASDELIEACWDSKELRQTIVDRMQAASKEHEVKSTPSFVFNNEETMPGAQQIKMFEKKIERMKAEQAE